MAKLDAEQCTRCHAKFRFQLTEDVSAWPKFTPKAPKGATGQRWPVK